MILVKIFKKMGNKVSVGNSRLGCPCMHVHTCVHSLTCTFIHIYTHILSPFFPTTDSWGVCHQHPLAQVNAFIVFGVRVVVSKRCNSRGVMGGKDGGYSKCDLCF